jgi:hypothetical protein
MMAPQSAMPVNPRSRTSSYLPAPIAWLTRMIVAECMASGTMKAVLA